MSIVIKNIPTVYDGVQFRSRIEARWYLILKKLHASFDYEYQGYSIELPNKENIWYLPDYHVFEPIPFIMEIKGVKPTQEELTKCVLLAKGLRIDTVMVYNGIAPKVSQLSTISINKHGNIVLRNPLIELFKTVDAAKRERILTLARNMKFD